MVDYQFLHANNILLYANRTNIFNASLVVTRDLNGVITNITFNTTNSYRSLEITSFKVLGTYLVLSCSTCNTNRGRIQIFNYLLALPPLVIVRPPPVAPANNMTLI